MTTLLRAIACLLLVCSLQRFTTVRHFRVTVTVPPGTDFKQLIISYHNGTETVKVKPRPEDKVIMLEGSYNARYATINIFYEQPGLDTMPGGRFWVTEQPAAIHFDNGWQHPVLTNAKNIDNEGGNNYKKWMAPVIREKDAYWEAHSEAIMDINSPERKVFFEKKRAVEDKQLAFVKQYRSTYYALWLFREELMIMGSVVPYGYQGTTVPQLRAFLQANFPEKPEDAFERATILKWLAAREVRTGAMAKDFTTLDIYGNKVTLKDCRGKYVLLNFWASWCKPCVAELPAIKKIHSSYSADHLVVIGISEDKDSSAFLKAVDRYGISWTKIFNKPDISREYAIPGLPCLFLIDPDGKIIYDRDEETPAQTDSLILLQQTLQKLAADQWKQKSL
ncbi:TlpA family protein disulfide reductase [Chitinophaga flava]|nr:TlpA disulfide reductase family protein [Chitinophaga flava]